MSARLGPTAAASVDRPHGDRAAPAGRSPSRSSARPATRAARPSGCWRSTRTSTRRARRSRPRPRPDRRPPPAPRVDRPRRSARRSPTSTPCSSPSPTARRPTSSRTSSRTARRSSTSGPTSACATRPTTRAGTASSTHGPTSSSARSTACRSCTAPSSRRSSTRPIAIVGSPGCYPTATLLALAPLARAGLIGDLVVDAKSGVSGAGRDAKPEMMFGEVNESVKAYGARRPPPRRRDRAGAGRRRRPEGLDPSANPGAMTVDFVPHLIPMTRGILSTCHVRPTRPIDQAELDALYAAAYADEPFVRVVATPPATKHTTGSNHVAGPRPARRADRADPRDRGRGQPRQGRRRPGRPGVQPRPRAARDGRPRAAAAGAVDGGHVVVRIEPAGRRRTRRVERRAVLPAGFRAGGATAGIKASGRPDLALILATGGPAAAAAVFTPNTFAAAPVRLSRANLAATSDDARGGFGCASAIISTSGSANAATGAAGDADQAGIGAIVAAALGIDPSHVLHLSTGIIGTRLPLDRVEAGRRGAWRRRCATMTTACGPPPRRCARPIRVAKVATTVAGPAGRRRRAGHASRSPASPRASG